MNPPIYLDYAATTPMHKEVYESMSPYFTEHFGNPSSSYAIGREAKAAIDRAKDEIAALMHVKSSEIYFTSGGTESNNWALIGYAFAHQAKGKHIITSSIEHPAVLKSCQFLETMGFRVTYLEVDAYGSVDAATLENAIEEDTILISIMFANNEVGTIQDIETLAAIAKREQITFHTDAIQAFGSHAIDIQQLQIDMLSVSAHKIYGPKGVGILYIKDGIKLTPLIHGGAQQMRKRAGTEDVAGIVGCAKAIALAFKNQREQNAHLLSLRDQLIKNITQIPGTVLTGHPSKRLLHHASFCFENIRSDILLAKLDQRGIYASAGSACSSGALELSYVLKSMGIESTLANGALRLTVGYQTTNKEIDDAINTLKEMISSLRK